MLAGGAAARSIIDDKQIDAGVRFRCARKSCVLARFGRGASPPPPPPLPPPLLRTLTGRARSPPVEPIGTGASVGGALGGGSSSNSKACNWLIIYFYSTSSIIGSRGGESYNLCSFSS